MSYYRSGNATLAVSEGGLDFDTSGTPMDQDWFCRAAEFLDPVEGAIARGIVAQDFGFDVLVEVWGLLGGLPGAMPPLPPKAPPKPPRARRAKA